MSDRFFIAPYDKDSGLRSNYKPFLIPDQAFSSLDNAYVFRGRVRKRFGSRWLSNDQTGTRLRLIIGQNPGDTFTFDVTTLQIVPAVGQMFSIGTNIYTVAQTGNLLVNGVATVATYDLGTGIVTIDGTGFNNVDVYMYPALPVMGLLSYESTSTNVEPTIAFDTKFAYQYQALGWERLATGAVDPGEAIWSGSNSQFFYGTTWVGDNGDEKILFVTNFNPNEPFNMRYLLNNTWYEYKPALTATVFMFSARILIPFHNYFIALTTWEGEDIAKPGTNYQNRARWTWAFSPTDPDAWRSDLSGRGSGLDASTTESIIGAEFVQDRLIVYFERSTWELAYTANQVQPFVWQRINTELGAESPFSVIPYDNVAIGIGGSGIHSCNGVSVDRIDLDIPTFIENIANKNEGPDRVYGIRDFGTELMYWTYPDGSRTADDPFPNKVLVYNYRNNTYGINDDTITCFGYFQSLTGVTWDSETVTWDSEESWDGQSGAPLYREIVAGNQQGFTFIIDSDTPTNSPNLFIAKIDIVDDIITLTSQAHGLAASDFIYLNSITGTGNIEDLNGTIVQILSVTHNTMTFWEDDIVGTYTGSGTISRVSNINIATKQYNFYQSQGLNCAVEKIDFQVDRTKNGRVSIAVYTSTNPDNIMAWGQVNDAIMGNGTLETSAYDLYPYELLSDRVTHSFFPQAEGSYIQLEIYLTDDQMMDTLIRDSDFQLHSMCFEASPTSRVQ